MWEFPTESREIREQLLSHPFFRERDSGWLRVPRTARTSRYGGFPRHLYRTVGIPNTYDLNGDTVGFSTPMGLCGEAARLFDIYVAALSASHDAQEPLPGAMRRNRPEFHLALQQKEDAHADLIGARRSYWTHVTEHKCREREC